MALIIDATLGGANSNSYVTLDESNEYFEARLHVQVWTDSNDDDKNRALVMACRRLGYEKYYGDRETAAQKLAFPRVGLGYLDGIFLDSTIPYQLSEAQMELALHMLSTDMSQKGVDTSNMKSVKVGSISVDYQIDNFDNVSTSYDELPIFVSSLLEDLSRTVSSGGSFSVSR